MAAQRQALRAAFGPEAAPQHRGVVQRMVVAAAPASTIDRIIAADVAFQLGRAGGSAVALQDIDKQKAGTYSVADSEWIVVCGHGNTSAIDGVAPEDMSGYLKKVTNHAKAGGVYLSACNSATIDDKGTSFLKRFQADFSGGGQGPQPHVGGATGYKINDFDEVSGEQQQYPRSTAARRWGCRTATAGIRGHCRDSGSGLVFCLPRCHTATRLPARLMVV